MHSREIMHHYCRKLALDVVASKLEGRLLAHMSNPIFPFFHMTVVNQQKPSIFQSVPYLFQFLQSRAMNDLVVHCELTTSIIDDQYTNASTAIGKGVVQS